MKKIFDIPDYLALRLEKTAKEQNTTQVNILTQSLMFFLFLDLFDKDKQLKTTMENVVAKGQIAFQEFDKAQSKTKKLSHQD